MGEQLDDKPEVRASRVAVESVAVVEFWDWRISANHNDIVIASDE